MRSEPDSISVQMAIVGSQVLRVARKHRSARRPPLLMFNGIGANLELAFPFMRALEDSEAVIFDVPGSEARRRPSRPYRPSTWPGSRATSLSSSGSARSSTSPACPGAADWRNSSLANIRRFAVD